MANAIVDGPVSRIEWVERRLRQAILDGEFDPGQRLLTAQLAEAYSVSPTPLREVLHRFAGEGLVEFVPQKGCRVTGLSERDSNELSDLRMLLDTPLLAGAATNLTTESSAAISESSRKLIALWASDRVHSRDAERLYRAFYNTVGERHPSSRLKHQASLVRELGSRYRLAGSQAVSVENLIESHRHLADGLRLGNHPQTKGALKAEIHAFRTGFREQAEVMSRG